ncbi:MAG: SDR family oxidoreductase [Treponema sp.]|nr:SDR family oxidoreductase [Treponema sp.]
MKDKVVVITGGASGIGRLMSLKFAAQGARVVAWDMNRNGLSHLENEAAEKHLFVKGMACDVSDKNAVYELAKTVARDIGAVDVLVNNAGVVSGKPLLNTPDEHIIATMNVNVLAHFWTCKAFLPSMLERNSGHIVTIASAAGLIGVKGLADYSASKFAVFGFDESIRMELRALKSAVRTTVVCPFFINTGMFDGVKTKFPLLLPILQSGYVADRIVHAVLKNKTRLILPWFASTTLLLRLFPPAILDVIAGFFGINHSMDEFKGRS